MEKRTYRNPTPTDRLNWLLGDMCTQLGFCSRVTAEELLAQGGPVTPQSFAVAILRAEGMNPEYHEKWRHELEARFQKRLGPSI
jgi:hypothetical protein